MGNIEVLKEIIITKKENIEQCVLISWYCLSQFLLSYMRYGNNKITQNNKEVYRMFLEIWKEENTYLNILQKNIKTLNVPDAFAFIDNLDEMNDMYIEYLYKVLDDLEGAYETGHEYSATIPKKQFKTILDNNDFRREVVRIVLGENILKDYFKFPDEFWDYIKNKTIVLDEGIEDGEDFTGVYHRLDKNDVLVDIKLYLPRITNMRTLLMNVQLINHAYLLYIQKRIQIKEMDYSKESEIEQQEFLENYFEPTYKRIFKN